MNYILDLLSHQTYDGASVLQAIILTLFAIISIKYMIKEISELLHKEESK